MKSQHFHNRMVNDLRKNGQEPTSAWKAGQNKRKVFAGFPYNINDKQTIIDYIKNKKEHHKKLSFEEDYRKFLIENGIDIDERYFLKDWFCPAFQVVDIYGSVSLGRWPKVMKIKHLRC